MSDSVEITHNEVFALFDLKSDSVPFVFSTVKIDLIAYIEIIAPDGHVEKMVRAFTQITQSTVVMDLPDGTPTWPRGKIRCLGVRFY
jgi:hypothetical protein